MARLFTPSEVQGLIPVLEMLFGRLLIGRDRRGQLVKEREQVSPEEQAELDAAITALTAELRELANKIVAVGGEVKDFERGLVDFPCQRGAETVLLCWQYGEKRLGYWHTAAEGFAGRKAIEAEDEEQHEVLLN